MGHPGMSQGLNVPPATCMRTRTHTHTDTRTRTDTRAHIDTRMHTRARTHAPLHSGAPTAQLRPAPPSVPGARRAGSLHTGGSPGDRVRPSASPSQGPLADKGRQAFTPGALFEGRGTLGVWAI